MSRTSSGKKKYEGRMRKLAKIEEKKQEEQRRLDAIEDEKWKIGAKDTTKETLEALKAEEKNRLKKERQLAYEAEFNKKQ
ncbi:hypothetical protein AAJ76_1900040730 [Vairimorpha ceranae]|uniref:LSO1/LSO2 domain-containing protein n=1 Tax=Vairimorpha ceranae TaxID=40302 RepID=A0A0F9ZD30_9MICR|nr:hypothetical protein AAJ76_1900040730 [Vairimorpha ceranae]KAF5139724.1 hypothetical protein G9O61_00g021070 [Vairimorpha ceranae]KKO75509.1 hypothetical protein AAJ76_1900040730 [Vairimorpha ceranae]